MTNEEQEMDVLAQVSHAVDELDHAKRYGLCVSGALQWEVNMGNGPTEPLEGILLTNFRVHEAINRARRLLQGALDYGKAKREAAVDAPNGREDWLRRVDEVASGALEFEQHERNRARHELYACVLDPAVVEGYRPDKQLAQALLDELERHRLADPKPGGPHAMDHEAGQPIAIYGRDPEWEERIRLASKGKRYLTYGEMDRAAKQIQVLMPDHELALEKCTSYHLANDLLEAWAHYGLCVNE